MANQETKIVCPVCGAEFAISEHTHVATGIVVGKDSNLGTISPTLVNVSKRTLSACEKISALEKAGVDVSNLFAVTNDIIGENKLVRKTDDGFVVVKDNDPMMAKIMSQGTIPNRRLFRRWIMSQVFHMLSSPDGFTEALNRKGYKYQWKMILEELRVQAKLQAEDEVNFIDRNRWFNQKLVAQMASDYITQLASFVDTLRKRQYNGRCYITLKGRHYFCDRVGEDLLGPLHRALSGIALARNAADLYTATQQFYNTMKSTYLPSDFVMFADFKSAYKGAGAYFTMKNMILFHDCRLYLNDNQPLTMIGSLKTLDDRAKEYATEGWRLFGVLKKFLKDNNIDIKAKMAEWRKN